MSHPFVLQHTITPKTIQSDSAPISKSRDRGHTTRKSLTFNIPDISIILILS